MSIAEFGRQKRKWLAQFLDLTEGIPSHDRFNAILAAIKPAEFEKCLLSWITALHEITDGQVDRHRRQDAAPQLRRGQQQVGHSHGQRLGHGQSHQPGPSGRRREEQRDHGDSQTAGNPGDFRLFGDASTRWAARRRSRGRSSRAGRRLRAGRERTTSPRCTRGSPDFFDDHLEDDFARMLKVSRHDDGSRGHGRERAAFLLRLSGARRSAGPDTLDRT